MNPQKHCHVVRPDYYMMLPKNGEKMNQSKEDSPELHAVYVPGKELCCPFPAHLSALEDCAPTCHRCVRRNHMAMVNCAHSDSGEKWGLAVGWILSTFIHQRNGFMWSNPRSSIGEAAAMKPSNLRQVLTET